LRGGREPTNDNVAYNFDTVAKNTYWRDVGFRYVGRQATVRPELPDAQPAPVLPLCLHVGHVGSVSIDEQMIRVHATALIATMTNIHSFRDWSVFDRPRKPMGVVAATMNSDAPVSVRDARTLPKVTPGQGIDLCIVVETLLSSPMWKAALSRQSMCRHAPKILVPRPSHLLRAMAFPIPSEDGPRKPVPLTKKRRSRAAFPQAFRQVRAAYAARA
jgi:hypothetical protein